MALAGIAPGVFLRLSNQTELTIMQAVAVTAEKIQRERDQSLANMIVNGVGKMLGG